MSISHCACLRVQVGQVSLDYEDDGRSMSSETRQLVEVEVRNLVQVGTAIAITLSRAAHTTRPHARSVT
jgi:hypothetical protein